MNKTHLKFLGIFLALTAIISIGMYLYFAKVNETKIFGCTQFDIYDGPDHTKLEPVDLNCNLTMLDLTSNSRANDLSVGLVEYDLNSAGIIFIVMLFVFAPFVLAYILFIIGTKLLEKRGAMKNSKPEVI